MFCYKCGATNDESANYCKECGVLMRQPAPPPTRPFEEDPAMRILLPVGRSGWAIAAGYLGLFSMVLVFAPFAILCSIIAIRDLKMHPKKCGMGRAIFGLVMGVLGTAGLVGIALVGLSSH